MTRRRPKWMMAMYIATISALFVAGGWSVVSHMTSYASPEYSTDCSSMHPQLTEMGHYGTAGVTYWYSKYSPPWTATFNMPHSAKDRIELRADADQACEAVDNLYKKFKTFPLQPIG